MIVTALSSLDTSFDGLRIRRIAGRLGGEVLDFRLSAALDDTLFKQLHAALLKHKALFFRGQDHLDDTEHQAFGERFGKIVAHPTVPAPAGTTFFELDASTGGGRADSWHTDVTFVADYPKICVLRGVTIPAFGGDTVWADTVAAYANLPEELKALADSLWAVHTNEYDYGATRERIEERRWRHFREVFSASVYETEHPLVHVHPETGQRSLLVGHFIRRIKGLSGADSVRILDLLHSHAVRLENTVRWNWQQDDVALWDNRSTLHFAINDYGDQPRVMRRVTVQGERAVSVHGERSRAIRVPEAQSAPTGPAAAARIEVDAGF